MPRKTMQDLMLSRAMQMLSQVDDMRRLEFALGPEAAWEPPLDLIETETEVLAYVALPGVDIATVEVQAEGATLVIRGDRPRPSEWKSAAILRLELPWGPFQRQVRVPRGCALAGQEAMDGHLVVRLTKPKRVSNDE